MCGFFNVPVICNKSCETGNGFLIYSATFAFSFRPHCQATDSVRAPGLGRREGEGAGHSWNRLMCKTQGNLLFFLLLTLRRNATLITHTGIHFLLVVYYVKLSLTTFNLVLTYKWKPIFFIKTYFCTAILIY